MKVAVCLDGYARLDYHIMQAYRNVHNDALTAGNFCGVRNDTAAVIIRLLPQIAMYGMRTVVAQMPLLP